MALNGKNKIYLLTIEFNSETEEIEYIAEELVDDRDVSELGYLELDEAGWDIDALEIMRDHYITGKS
tara:strand:+ start:1238 stop:1438 length:201 start_codon:yes stop_codon:yes gene_type:complete